MQSSLKLTKLTSILSISQSHLFLLSAYWDHCGKSDFNLETVKKFCAFYMVIEKKVFLTKTNIGEVRKGMSSKITKKFF